MPSETPFAFDNIARLPAPGDNVAIATRQLDAGTKIELPGGSRRELRHTILLGHRFATDPIAKNSPLLSWGLPFGTALRNIEPGEYVCNAVTLEALAARQLPGVSLPAEPNFFEEHAVHELDEKTFRPSEQVAAVSEPETFSGYRRPGNRGVGTRNFIVVLGTSSLTGPLAKTIAAQLQDAVPAGSGLDGIVAIAHTEGGGPKTPNNRMEVLRALAGFMVHANVGAVLAVDQGDEPINNTALRTFIEENKYAIELVPHGWISIGDSPHRAIESAKKQIIKWIPTTAAARRTKETLVELKIALQCGGSDAFSGVSGNPLAAQVAREVIRNGGSANHAETDELIGAESYMLEHVRDAQTARRFLAAVERFKERLSWHGETAEGNPSAGNRLRGLYNIILKSLGAAAKKAPDVRMDHVIDYAEPLPGPGFTFMDSPGNDLESIAGQVASGCNLIFFITGNGSITNFPFVPTLKFTTTTERHELLINEMDVNAGEYLDGAPMDELTRRAFDLTIEVAGGERTKGERAGHSQVSLWRDWAQTGPGQWREVAAKPEPNGRPLKLKPGEPAATIQEIELARIGLIMPTSLCAGQIARMAAERSNASGMAGRFGLSGFVSLTHTEGCGFAGHRLQEQLLRTYTAYAMHPLVGTALFLEHGCERTPNDLVRGRLESDGFDPKQFGWVSIQLDGGIERVLAKIEAWFASRLETNPVTARKSAPSIGLLSDGDVPARKLEILIAAIRAIVASNGSVFIPESDALLADKVFRRELIGDAEVRATLAWGQRPSEPGLHIVATETVHWMENATGLGACGAHVIVAAGQNETRPEHPLVGTVRLSAEADVEQLMELVAKAARSARTAAAIGETDFQITRGLLGVSA